MVARKCFTSLAVLIVLLAIAAPVRAQLVNGSVSGTVKDPQGAVIPGAAVTLVSETRGTQLGDVFTNASGDFVFATVPPDKYSVQVMLSGFKSLKRTDIAVSAGDHVGLTALVLEVGGLDEKVEVRGEAQLIQTQSGERSFTIPTESVQNLPIVNRSFTALTSLAPGVDGNNRIGGGGGNNIMIDGVSAVDTGSNAILLQVNVESIAEVKVLTSGYQAEFGRSSGLQVTAVTKSGTNSFHGSLYDVQRNSDWNANTKTNILNGAPKAVVKEKDLGFSIGGPVGKPGRSNKLFFFYAQEFAPRTSGGDTVRFRVPTALERAGDFSQTYDNNGNLYNLIRDASTGLPCTAANTAGCFQSGGVLGRIPANRLYPLGQSILGTYPLPTIANAAGLPYNYEVTRPTETAMGWQPALRLDYTPSSKLRITGKYTGWAQTNKVFLGNMPGITDSTMYHPLVFTDAFTATYTLNSTTFLEATYGHSQNELTGCALAQGGTGPTFCTTGVPTGAQSNLNNVGLGGLPTLFPLGTMNQQYYAYQVLSAVQPAMFQNGVLLKTPNFTWGSRVGNATNVPPNVPFSGFLNKNATDDFSISVTKVKGSHTFKGGFYNTHSLKIQNGSNNNGATTAAFPIYNFAQNTSNPLDSTFGFANAVLGVTNSVTQRSIPYIEGSFVYNNTEGYIQDNWRVNNRFTLDYGIRFVHQQPQYDSLGQSSNFLPDRWSGGLAPILYLAGCTTGVTCTGNNRQAKNPITGQLLGVGSAPAIGTIVPGTGSATNALFLSGQGIADTTYTWPSMGYAPRFGAAYDLRGDQRMVVRGGAGVYFDRPSGNSIFSQVVNPPNVSEVTINFADLRTLGKGLQAAPALSVFEYAGGLPTSVQWNTGVQMSLPWASTLDIAYVGQHAWNQYVSVNLNAIDFGAAFLPANQDSTQATTLLGSNTVSADQMRAYRGYGAITQQNSRGWNTFHSLQLSFQRRFSKGLSFGFNDTWSLSNKAQTAARLQHNADGSFTYRADQAQADDLLQVDPTRHVLKGNLVWALPKMGSGTPVRQVAGALLNDWQLSSVWTGSTAAPYTGNGVLGFTYNNGAGSANLTGSPDYAPRIRVISDPGSGCSSDPLRQFNALALAGPLAGSVGLESSPNVVKGCFQQTLDLSIARNIKFGAGKSLQLRLDVFNALNFAIVTGRNTTLNIASPTDPTITNLPFDANGNPIASRSLPSNAGVGVATTYQTPRSAQAQIRFAF